MTKADLVEKVTGVGELTRHDGEVIVETIFDAVIGLCRRETRLKFADLARSAFVSATPHRPQPQDR